MEFRSQLDYIKAMVQMEDDYNLYAAREIEKEFHIPDSQLTSAGLRQRYLLGRHNAAKYPTLKQDKDIYVQSTAVYRTI